MDNPPSSSGHYRPDDRTGTYTQGGSQAESSKCDGPPWFFPERRRYYPKVSGISNSEAKSAHCP
jgi:hypothetical protein